MNDNTDYTLDDLLAEAKNDESWEPDPELREQLTAMLKMQLFM